MTEHRDGSVDEAASSIFDALPEDPFGEGEEEMPAEQPGDQDPDAGAEEDDGFDAEGAAALTDADEPEDEPEESEEADEEPEDEPEDEPEADEPESDEPEDDEDEDGESSSEEDLVTVRVNGEDVEIPLSEALAGYSRTASWTKKSQKLADERKAFEAEQAAVKQERSVYGTRLQALEEQLGANLAGSGEPNPDDPDYERKWIALQEEKRQLAAVQQERHALHQRMQADAARDFDARVLAENEKLVELIPEWRDDDVAVSEKTSLAKYAVEVMGFDTEDVDSLVDHRLVMLLRKAAGYDALVKDKETVKKRKKKAPVLKPGQTSRRASSKSKKSRRKAAAKRDKLRQSGSVQDAADFIYDSLDDL